MGKTGKTVTKVTYGILNLAMKPIYERMKEDRKEEVRRENESLNRASIDAIVEARRFEVHQPLDSIVFHKSIW